MGLKMLGPVYPVGNSDGKPSLSLQDLDPAADCGAQ